MPLLVYEADLSRAWWACDGDWAGGPSMFALLPNPESIYCRVAIVLFTAPFIHVSRQWLRAATMTIEGLMMDRGLLASGSPVVEANSDRGALVDSRLAGPLM